MLAPVHPGLVLCCMVLHLRSLEGLVPAAGLPESCPGEASGLLPERSKAGFVGGYGDCPEVHCNTNPYVTAHIMMWLP